MSSSSSSYIVYICIYIGTDRIRLYFYLSSFVERYFYLSSLFRGYFYLSSFLGDYFYLVTFLEYLLQHCIWRHARVIKCGLCKYRSVEALWQMRETGRQRCENRQKRRELYREGAIWRVDERTTICWISRAARIRTAGGRKRSRCQRSTKEKIEETYKHLFLS